MDDLQEIVHVLDDRSLIDSESYQRALHPDLVGRLAAGFYIVRWPSTADRRRYDALPEYLGPYDSRQLAEERQDQQRRATT